MPDSPTAPRRWYQRRAWRWAGAVVGALVLLAALTVGAGAVALERAGSGPAAGWAATSDADALWMGHAWVDGRKSQPDLDALAATLSATGVHDVFVHIGPLTADGTLRPALYTGARDFLARFRRTLPGVRVSAWIGGVTGGGGIDLADPQARARIVTGAADALRTGFDGVHYDLEPIADGDQGLLDLLDQTRALNPGLLSVAVPQIEPLPWTAGPMRLLDGGRPKYWTSGYLTRVADRVTQIAVMAYDTALPTQGLFRGYVARQTALALRAVPDRTGLLIGLPAYHTNAMQHHASAETVAAAAHGVRVALTAHGPRSGAFGVGMYVDFAATAADWTALRTGWSAP